ncbi:MAG: general secretion pathway protein GspK [Dyella sp.]|uniref:general secretion pathway protein GspK n=1 Tax=Dyella sp. TaxID=1869338 RepID=UPI003F7E18A7
MNRTHERGRQRGVALLVVLWACTLLAVLLGGYAILARTEGLQARYAFAQTQAQYAAEAGVARAIYALQDPQPALRWIPDGRPYTFAYGPATVQVAVIDENGKVDLNAAAPAVLTGLFTAAGMQPRAAQALTERVVAWRSFKNMVGPDPADAAYAAAGLDYGPRHGPFASIEELRMVLGMPAAVYRTIAPQVTLWSGRDAPNPATAPPLALAAIPGMDAARIAQTQQAREALDPATAMASGGGVTHSIRSQATLADGTKAVVRATVRLRGIGAGGPPYAVLRWQEGDGE